MHTRIIGIKEKYTVFQNGHLFSFSLRNKLQCRIRNDFRMKIQLFFIVCHILFRDSLDISLSALIQYVSNLIITCLIETKF